jgi:hypothetical protein
MGKRKRSRCGQPFTIVLRHPRVSSGVHGTICASWPPFSLRSPWAETVKSNILRVGHHFVSASTSLSVMIDGDVGIQRKRTKGGELRKGTQLPDRERVVIDCVGAIANGFV